MSKGLECSEEFGRALGALLSSRREHPPEQIIEREQEPSLRRDEGHVIGRFYDIQEAWLTLGCGSNDIM